ncbi:MAG: ThiF family adenylyltransferase [Patescibacteria group bacterium]
MDELTNLTAQKTQKDGNWKPVIFDASHIDDKTRLHELLQSDKVQYVVNDYEEQLKELFQVQDPSKVYTPEFNGLFASYLEGLKKERPTNEHGRWIYYPWLSTLVHALEPDSFQLVRTARNQHLINREEQDKFYNATIGIAGQSVGNSVALAIVLQGGGRRWKIADHDRLALTNTNRIRVGIQNLGLLKTEMTARQIFEINPYAEVEIFSDGLTPENADTFFDGLTIVIDEIDNLAIKYLIREQAQKRRLAVVMAADNGDNGVVDVERYDLDPATPFFHGRMGEVSFDMLKNLDKFGIGKMITKHVGPENVTERMQQSLLEMGKTVVSWPQLGGAALLNGSAVAYCVRKILNGQSLESNRALISLDEKLTPDYNSDEQIAKRQQIADTFRKIFGL